MAIDRELARGTNAFGGLLRLDRDRDFFLDAVQVERSFQQMRRSRRRSRGRLGERGGGEGRFRILRDIEEVGRFEVRGQLLRVGLDGIGVDLE